MPFTKDKRLLVDLIRTAANHISGGYQICPSWSRDLLFDRNKEGQIISACALGLMLIHILGEPPHATDPYEIGLALSHISRIENSGMDLSIYTPLFERYEKIMLDLLNQAIEHHCVHLHNGTPYTPFPIQRHPYAHLRLHTMIGVLNDHICTDVETLVQILYTWSDLLEDHLQPAS